LARSSTAVSAATPPRLVVVFLRGAVDSLNVVVPYREPFYYQARPQIALPQPGQNGGVLDLDGRFGLHPQLANLLPFWQQQQLAFIHACGSPDPTRSHFDAQTFMETATPGVKSTRDGWMNRLLGILNNRGKVQAVNLRQTQPQILLGTQPVTNLGLDDQSLRPAPLDQPQIRAAFDRLYQGNDPLSRTYQQSKVARQEVLTALESNMEMQAANNGARPIGAFARGAQRLGQLLNRDRSIQLAFVDVGGWDTHVGQSPRLAQQLQGLGQGLQGMVQAMGPSFANTMVLVMSEFGRTVRENGNRGTDHGHGTALWVLGGKVRGGKIYGEWPGLSETSLYEGRDLQITTDFRVVLGSILTNHLQLSPSQVGQVLLGYQGRQNLPLV
jgi:uncharacterized protein (DUF1501 family)